MADELDTSRDLPPVDYRDVFDEVRALLVHEVQVEHEQDNLRAAGERFNGDREVVIPRLLPFSMPHITAMDRVFGEKVTRLPREHDSHNRRQLAATIVRSLIADVIFSRQEVTIFHADPHAGNLFAADNGRLAILDWSLIGRVRRDQLEQLAQLGVGSMMYAPSRIAQTIELLAIQMPDRTTVRRVIERELAHLPRALLPSPRWAMQLLDALAMAGVRFASDLLLLRNAYFTLDGVIADVCPECSIDSILTTAMVERFILDWPLRAFRPPSSRDFATHLSNADLMAMVLSAPITMAQRAIQACQELTAPAVCAWADSMNASMFSSGTSPSTACAGEKI